MTKEKEFDLVLMGATGFTGRLVAEHLVKRHPPLRWALAGRSLSKLESLCDELTAFDPDARHLPRVVADVGEAEAMQALAARTRVVCTTVGPYARYGSALVAACAAEGTAYCDLTGETYWIRAMIDAHHARAVASGARIVHCCGFDSIPSDLGVLMLHEAFAARGEQLAEAHYRLVHAKGGVSGGTAASMLEMLERLDDPAVRRALTDPYLLDPEDSPHGPDQPDARVPQRDRVAGRPHRWAAPFVMAAVNTRVVRRSNALLDFAYGHDFRYDEAVDTGRGLSGAIAATTTSLGLALVMAAAAFRPGRALLRRVLPSPGEGPSRAARERGRFRVEIHARSVQGTPRMGVIEGRLDPGYGQTAIMLGEAALCLAQDTLPLRAGVLTPAVAMGMTLVQRLQREGMTFAVQ